MNLFIRPSIPELLSGNFYNSDLIHIYYRLKFENDVKIQKKIETIIDLYFIGKIINFEVAKGSLQLMGVNTDFLTELQRIITNNMEISSPVKSSRWTQLEDDRLIYYMFRVRDPKWNEVSNYVQSRNDNGCQCRWLKYWLPLFKENNFVIKEFCGKRRVILKELATPEESSKSDNINGRSEIIKQNVNLANLKEKINLKHMEIMRMYQRITDKDHQISELKNQIMEKESLIAQERNNILSFFDDDVSEVIKNNYVQKNLKYHKRYVLKDKIFWVKQLVKGTSHFDEVRRVLKGPHRSTVYLWIQKERKFKVPSNDCLKDISNIEYTINYWIRKFHIEKGTKVTICYDAIAFDLDLVIEPEGIKWGIIEQCDLEHPAIEYKKNPHLYEQLFYQLKNNKNLVGAAFLVMIMPLDHHQPFICHVFYQSHGSASKKFMENLEIIRKAIVKVGLKYYGDGFDADPCYSQAQNDYFDEWSKFINSPSSTQVHQLFNPNHHNLFNDPSHILKRMRKRFIKHNNLFIVPYSDYISIEKFRRIFPEISDSVFEDNNMISMNDWHPAKIFSAGNALWLLRNINKNNDLVELTIFIIIGATMNCVLRGKGLTRKEQLILCYTGLFGSLWAYSVYMSNKYNKKKQFIMTKNMIIHCANYFFGVIGILSQVQDSFSIGRIGSICLEHFFGRIRRSSNGENTHKKFVSSLQRIQIIDKFKDNSDQKIPYRWFETGVVERGCSILEKESCISIMLFMRDLFQKSGFVCTRESAFYQVQDGVASNENAESLIIKTLEKIALREIVEFSSHIKSWSLHSTSINLGKKKGRNIIGRYQDQNSRTEIKKAQKETKRLKNKPRDNKLNRNENSIDFNKAQK